MKLILYKDKGHHKNFDAIVRMCAETHIDFEFTDSLDRLKENDYDILVSFAFYVDLDIIPPHVKIIFGPHAIAFPNKHPIFFNLTDERLKKRAIYLSLSEWVKDLIYEWHPSFFVPVKPLPFAINTKKFIPNETIEKDLDCLIYIKHRSEQDKQRLLETINKTNMKYEMITYGSYNEDQYISLLHRAKFMIVLDAHESQGFALQEAMSCNVPLLVLDINSMYEEIYYGRNIYANMKPMILKATSVPYWSEECGLKATFSDLPEKIEQMKESWHTFRSRDFIVRELSEVPCMNRMLNAFN